MTKIAIFDLTGCEGCEFHLLSLNELLLDVFQDFEITNWRLLSESTKKDFDIAFIEGAATTPKHLKLLKEIRQTSKIVVALGACAISGNFFAELTPDQRKKLAPKIYTKDYQLKAKFLDPIEKHIKVDEKIEGCPPNLEKFKKVLQSFKDKKITSKIQSVPPPDYVAKIEGHGQLKINFRQKTAEFQVEESERLVEGILLGKKFTQPPNLVSRICGICPIAHNLCSLKALENTLKITLSPETTTLREILLAAQMVKSHLLHLFFLVLPDYAGLKSSIELSQKYPAEFHLMLTIKRASEQALQTIAGSTAFPTNTALGGFLAPPSLDQLLSLRDALAEVTDEAQDLIKLFASFKSSFLETKTAFLTTEPQNGQYPLYQSELIPEVKELTQKGSTAKIGLLSDQTIVKVGALPRLAGFADRLNPQAQKAFQAYPLHFQNPFENNLAQAIEILHYLEEMSHLIDSLVDQNLKSTRAVEPQKVSGPAEGEACLEAPRGILLHQVKINQNNTIAKYNIIPPTQINLASLEKEAQELVKKEKGSPEKTKKEAEKLIRAFDPCITCAVH